MPYVNPAMPPARSRMSAALATAMPRAWASSSAGWASPEIGEVGVDQDD